MECLAQNPVKLQLQKNAMEKGIMELAFSLGWAVADEAHLPALPEAMVHLLSVSAVRITVVHWNGTPLMEHAYARPEERTTEGTPIHYEIEENLGTDYAFRLSVESPTELSVAQMEALTKATRLIHQGMECILVRQRNPDSLGNSFAGLSDREWQICLALERPNGEKEIAGMLDCSRHTVHSYIKSLYRKLQVKSRLQMLDRLKRSREEMRRHALKRFATSKSNEQRPETAAAFRRRMELI